MINEFQKKLNNIEDLRKNSAITSGEIFRQYEVLEKTALQLREAKFYLSRGNFFYESAENENNKSSQQGLYHYALKNYKKALEYNSQLENLAERIKQLETLLNVKLISQGEKQKFFAPTSATLEEKENTLKKEELTEEQLKDYDRVKALFYKFATSMNKS